MLIVQAIILMPCSWALASNSEMDITCSDFMTFFIIIWPSPPKLNFDNPSFSGWGGSIIEKPFCRVLLGLPVALAPVDGLRSAASPQKVKNMVTSSSMAAAPLAMMNAAITSS